VSLCWAVGSCVGLRDMQYNDGEKSAQAAVNVCAMSSKSFEQCWDENLPFRQLAMAPYWPPILFVSLAPIPLFWLFGWATIAAVRWIRLGFAADVDG
jgi:hypothetical protein